MSENRIDEPREVAQYIAAVGAKWGEVRGYGRERGIAAMVEAVAELGVTMRRDDDGEIYWSLPKDTQEATP